MACEILFKTPYPYLIVPCKHQTHVKGEKCFKNKCIGVNKVFLDGYVANVASLDNSVVVKWNIDKMDKNEMIREMRIQNIASSIGVAPRILDYYEDDDYFYFFMENLVEKGYYSLYDLYIDYDSKGEEVLYIPDYILEKVAKTIVKLNKIGIPHNDLHSKNVFYNPKRKHILLIDFGESYYFKSGKEASEMEFYSYNNSQNFPLNTIRKYNNPDEVMKSNWNYIWTIAKRLRK